MLLSVIIRTLNEEKYLDQLLQQIFSQDLNNYSIEVIIVDSGSTDNTLLIAKNYKCKIEHINKDNFSFGRSLNIGCSAAEGEILIFISGHCIPNTNKWILKLIEPIIHENISYTYGRQIGNETSKFSEKMIFEKYYPAKSKIPQNNFFCNNANSAIKKNEWLTNQFDENLTGLEDLYLSKKIFLKGRKIGYVSDATVFHLHNESWKKIKIRFERESIALQKIMPEVHFNLFDFLRYTINSIIFDLSKAIKCRKFLHYFTEIILYRTCQYWGSYIGNKHHRFLSKKLKENYFFPK